jgi:pimeloyl-ACP methyl ester carboxylesterase
MKEEFLKVSGLKTRVRRAGAGEPLLLIHGLGAPQMWQRVIGPLSASFDLIVPDLPGFGESECPPRPFGDGDYAEVLSHLAGGAVHVAGISYGGQIAVAFGRMYPQRLRSLILIASTGLQGSPWFARPDPLWRLAAGAIGGSLLRSRRLLSLLSRRSYYDISNRPERFVDDFLRPMASAEKREAWLQALRNVLTAGPEFGRELSRLRQPALIVWGSDDRTLPVKYAYEFHRLLPDAQLSLLPACGHSVPLERPAELCEAIRNFLPLTAVTHRSHGT